MASKWAAYKRDQRARKKAEYAAKHPSIGAEKGEDGRYPDRQYNEDGSLVLFEQRCPICAGIWNASLSIPCPYCDDTGKRKRAA